MKHKLKAHFRNIKTNEESIVITYINSSTDTISFDFEDTYEDIIETYTIAVTGYSTKVLEYIEKYHKNYDIEETNPFELTIQWLHHVFSKDSKYGNELLSINNFIEHEQ